MLLFFECLGSSSVWLFKIQLFFTCFFKAHYGAGIFSDHYANGQPSGLGSFGHSTGGDYHDTHNKHNYCIWLFDDDIYYLRRFIEQPFFIACQTLWSFELFFSCLALIILLPAPILKAPKAAMALSAASGLITFFCCE